MNEVITEDQPKESTTLTPASEVPVPPKQSFEPGHADKKAYVDNGWSWGAAMMWPQFIIATRKYAWLWLLLLMLVPFVNFFAWIAFFILFGIKGRSLAASSRTFDSREQYLGFMKGVDHAGKVMFYVILGLFSIALTGIVLSVVLASMGNARERAQDASLRQQAEYQRINFEFEQ